MEGMFRRDVVVDRQESSDGSYDLPRQDVSLDIYFVRNRDSADLSFDQAGLLPEHSERLEVGFADL